MPVINFPAANAQYKTTFEGETTGYGFTRFIKMGGNLYFNSDTGLYRKSEPLDTPADTRVLMRGIQIRVSTGDAVAPDPVPDGEFTQYAALVGIRDAKGVVHLGVPTYSAAMEWATGFSVQLDLTLPLDITTDHFYQIYRTKAFPTEQTDGEYFLIYENQPTGAEVSAGAIEFQDRYPEAIMGQGLYTNANQETILAENWNPGLVKDMTEYAGHAFYANYRGRYGAVFGMVATTNDEDELGIYKLTGLNGGSFTISTNSASPVITFSAPHGLTPKIGAAFANSEDTGSDFDQFFSRVASFTATTITLEDNLPNTTVATTNFDLSLGDWLQIGDVVLYASNDAIPKPFEQDGVLYVNFFAPVGLATPEIDVQVATGNLIAAYNVAIKEPGYEDNGVILSSFVSAEIGAPLIRLLQEQPEYGYTVVTLDTNNEDAWTPNITLTGFIEEDKEEHKLWFSKYQIPDAVPLLNFLYVGSSNYPIYRIIGLQNALLIFKQDGVYSLTGTTPGTFRLRLLDPSLILSCWNSCAVVGDVCLALTNRGVVAVDGFSVKVLSQDIHQDLVDITNNFELKTMDEQFWCHGTAVLQLGLYVLSLSYARDSRADIFVLDTNTGMWTRWYSHAAASVYRSFNSQTDGQFRFISSIGDQAGTKLPSAALFTVDPLEKNDSLTAAADVLFSNINYSTETLTLGLPSSAEAEPAQLTNARTSAEYIPELVDDTFELEENIDVTNFAAEDVITVDYAIPVLAAWAPFTAGSGTDLKHFDRVSLTFRHLSHNNYKLFYDTDFTKDGLFWDTIDSTDQDAGPTYSYTVSRTSTGEDRPEAHSAHVPRGCRRATRLKIAAYFNEVDADFELESVDLEFTPGTGVIKRSV